MQRKDRQTSILFALLSQSIWLPVFLAGHQWQPFADTSRRPSQISSNINLTYLYSNIQQQSFLSLQKGKQLASFEQFDKKQDTGIVLRSPHTHHRALATDFSRAHTTGQTFGRLASQSSIPHAFLNRLSSNYQYQVPPSVRSVWQPIRESSIHHLYTRSELLGGTLTLENLNEPPMPAVARAERAQWSRSGDPLAPLPELWREPMRRALNTLINSGDHEKLMSSPRDRPVVLSIESARSVHVPSSRVRRASEIPLALQHDGTVDILNNPDDPAILEEVNRWAVRQRPPAKGKVTVAVVHFHPFIPETSLTTSPKGLSPSSQPQLLTHKRNRSEKPVPAPQAVVLPKSSGHQVTTVSSPSERVSDPPATPDPSPATNTESAVSPPPVSEGYASPSKETES